MRGFCVSLGNASIELSDLREDLPVVLSSSVAFPSLLRFAERILPVGDRTAVGSLELLVGVVH